MARPLEVVLVVALAQAVAALGGHTERVRAEFLGNVETAAGNS
jgi:hypothetical protein